MYAALNVQTDWLTMPEAAVYARRQKPNSYRSIVRMIRRGLIPKEYVGGDRELLVKRQGVDIGLQKLRAARLRRTGRIAA